MSVSHVKCIPLWKVTLCFAHPHSELLTEIYVYIYSRRSNSDVDIGDNKFSIIGTWVIRPFFLGGS